MPTLRQPRRGVPVGHLVPKSSDSKPTAEDIIGSRITIDPDTGCWNYTGSIRNGYGYYNRQPVHRLVYEIFNGKVRSNVHVHHLCRNKRCCRPSHLEAMRDSDHMSLHAKERIERKPS